MTRFTPRSVEEINQTYRKIVRPSAPLVEVPAAQPVVSPLSPADVVVEVRLTEAFEEVPLSTDDIVEAPSLEEIGTVGVAASQIDRTQILPEVGAAPIAPTDFSLAPDPVAQVAAFDDLDDGIQQSRSRAFMRFVGILLWVTTVVLLLLTTFGFLTRSNNVTKFGDYGVFYQRSENMEPDIGYGSLVIGPLLGPNSGQSGDDVVFVLRQSDDGAAVSLRRIVNVMRTGSTTSYDTISLADRENSSEVFEDGNAVMKRTVSVPGLGFLIDWLTENVWWIIGAFMLSLLLVTVFRPRPRAR